MDSFKKMTIAARRQLALYHLRINPEKRTQIRGGLTDGECGRCAIGLICDAFGVKFRSEIPSESHSSYSPYWEIERLLGMSALELDWIWKMNDSGRKTFAEIADTLDRYWNPVEEES